MVADVQVATKNAPDDVAYDLGLDTDAQVVRRRRYIFDGKTVLSSASYFPTDIVSRTQI